MRRVKILIIIIRYDGKGNISLCSIYLLAIVWHLSSIFLSSFARLPIVRGMRSRKYKSQHSTATTTNQQRCTIIAATAAAATASKQNSTIATDTIGSDEENTSDYSHPPSSQHSTLESNPDVPKCLRALRSNSRHPTTKDDLSDSSGSESEENFSSVPPSPLPTQTTIMATSAAVIVTANATNCNSIQVMT